MDEEKRELESEIKRTQQSPYLIPGAILFAGALIAFAVFYAGVRPAIPSGGRTAQVSGSATGSVDPVDSQGDDPVLGDPQAPVTIVEFSDFQCPFCGKFFQTSEKQIIEKYIKTGKAKFIYRDFPLTGIHEHAQKAAEAGQCSHEQGKFWQYHDLLFQRQAELGVSNFKRWAEEIGLNKDQFNQCLDSGKYADEVQKDFQDGQALGVTGTPGTFVNGRLIVGSVPFAQFESAIEEALGAQ